MTGRGGVHREEHWTGMGERKCGSETQKGVESTRVEASGGGSLRRVHFDPSVVVRPRTRSHRSANSTSALVTRFVSANSQSARFVSASRFAAPGTVALLQAARDNEEVPLYQALADLAESEDVNAADNTGRVSAFELSFESETYLPTNCQQLRNN